MAARVGEGSSAPPESADALRSRLEELEQTIAAIRTGAVDAVVVNGPHGDQVFTFASADHLFRRFVERMSDGAVTIDEDATVLWANRRLARMLHRPLERIMGGAFLDLVMPVDLERCRRVLGVGQPRSASVEVRLTSASGDPVRVRLRVATVSADGPDVRAVVITDLTAQRRREAEVRRAQRQLERLNEHLEDRVRERTAELEAFSYSISHDLRAPLRAIAGYSRIVLNEHADRLDAEGRRNLDVVIANVARMDRLIDDLLVFSRLGRVEVVVGRVETTAIVNAVVAEVRASEPHRTVHVSCSALPAVHGDRAMVRQLWFNLIANAFKFTRPRAVATIDIRAATRGASIEFSVRDNGVGFDPAYTDQLFAVFSRLHPADDFEGTGIGLAIARRVVERHGGSIRGIGAVDLGATFSFSLPAAR